MNWSEFVARLIAGETQVTVSQKTGIDQTTISRWLRGANRPKDPATVAHFAQVYAANVLEAFVAAGFLSPEEAGMPPTPAFDFAAMVDADPALSREAKIHLKNQYGLLKDATVSARALALREQIERLTSVDERTRNHLLSFLDGEHDSQATVAAVIARELHHPSYPDLVPIAARQSTGNEVETLDDNQQTAREDA